MFAAIGGQARYIGTCLVSKHRFFVWLDRSTVPENVVITIARSDDATFGILSSSFHELWALRMGTSLEDRPRYTPTTTFETFPFPEGLTPNLDPADYTNPHADAIAEAARTLNDLRERWLNPPELVKRVPEVVEGYPDRLLPVDASAEKELKKRTLTNLYNARPAWLDNTHKALDAAVAAAYGWDDYSPDMPEDEILVRLLALNLERAHEQDS
jgi:type II restriction/modification system DNA methylase subunit YeeA